VFNKILIRIAHVACLVLVAATLFTAPVADAAKLRKQNLTQLISEAETIVFGTVSSVTDGFDANGTPYTEVTITVGSAAKGNVDEGTDFTFRQWGLVSPRKTPNGKVYFGVSPEGFPRWFEGETVAAFMYKPARLTGLQTTAGMAQGKFVLQNGSLANEFNNVGLFENVEIKESLLTDEQHNMITTGGPVAADAFLELVGRAVQEQWIANGEMK